MIKQRLEQREEVLAQLETRLESQDALLARGSRDAQEWQTREASYMEQIELVLFSLVKPDGSWKMGNSRLKATC
jgi:hypothetical protein